VVSNHVVSRGHGFKPLKKIISSLIKIFLFKRVIFLPMTFHVVLWHTQGKCQDCFILLLALV